MMYMISNIRIERGGGHRARETATYTATGVMGIDGEQPGDRETEAACEPQMATAADTRRPIT